MFSSSKKNQQEDQFEDMGRQVQQLLAPSDQILLKGSNSMGLAKLVNHLVEN